jgi:Zn finger protein HypA/HybF involved in hydrogenase expression
MGWSIVPSFTRAGGIASAQRNSLAAAEVPELAAEAYCVKCKAKREIKDAVQITMKNGRPAVEGKCPTCGTKMFKIGSA